MTELYAGLHDAYTNVLQRADNEKINPRDLVIDLILFAARESAFAHCQIMEKFNFEKKEADTISNIFGQIFAKQMCNALLELKDVLN